MIHKKYLKRFNSFNICCTFPFRSRSQERSTGGMDDLDRSRDRNMVRSMDRNMDRSRDRNMDRSLDRNMDRSRDRNMDRSLDKNMDRSRDRDMERSRDRNADKGMDRTIERNMENTASMDQMGKLDCLDLDKMDGTPLAQSQSNSINPVQSEDEVRFILLGQKNLRGSLFEKLRCFVVKVHT